MIEAVENLKAVPISFSGGVNEIAASDSLDPGDCVKMTNWRLSKDGKRLEKRAGLYEEYQYLDEPVYGYSTYWNGSTPSQFCQIAVLETSIKRKVDTGAWTNIYSFPTDIEHIVKPLEIEGKQYIITEKGSRVIQDDGSVRQIGISAPTTIPTVTASYVSAVTPPLNDTFSTYADTTALNAVWTDEDTGSGASTLATSDPDSLPGPNNDLHYTRFYTSYAIVHAKRSRQLTAAVTNIYSIELATYFKDLNAFSGMGAGAGFRINIWNGSFAIKLIIASDGVWIVPTHTGAAVRISTETTPVDKWIRWNFAVDGSDERNVKITAYRTISGTMLELGSAEFYTTSTAQSNYVELDLFAGQTWVLQELYLDYIRITPQEKATAILSGIYRYAVSYAKSGDYGCESNPIKSLIGTVAFSGTGTNDMTVHEESTYTGNATKTLRVKVKTSANPCVVQWSDDAGHTWSGEMPMMTKTKLAYGIIVSFATTGNAHIADDYWEIPCYAISSVATKQQIELTSIPVSSDLQVDQRIIYRTIAGGATYYYLTTLYDNSTTFFYDNMADALLGDEMEEDRDVLMEISDTIGRSAEWWDDRLWVADHIENIVYFSAVRSGGGIPEEFDVVSRFVPIRRGDHGDTITALKAYKDALYVFKRNDIFIIQKAALTSWSNTSVGYGVYHLNSDVGCVTVNCVEQVNDFLMFPSERGIEIYDGVKPYAPEFSLDVNQTYLTADPAEYNKMSMVHDKEFNEVWLSIPNRLSAASPITIVWNYIRNKFYFFQFYKTPQCLVACKDSTGKRVVKMGTHDGLLLLCDYGTADNTTPITATYRKGWLDMSAHGIARLLQTEYELPQGKAITLNVYVNMDYTVSRTASLTGSDVSTIDAEIRRILADKIELGLRPRYMSIEYINAQDCGGPCKLNEAVIFVRPDVIKGKILGE